MVELRCPQCGASHTARQSFCGECGYALQAGVTRPLPHGSPPAVAARVAAGDGLALRGREAPPARRLVTQGVPLLLGLIVLGLGLLWLRSGAGLEQLGAPPAPPHMIVDVRPGQRVELRPGVVLTLTNAYLTPSDMGGCGAMTQAFWDFELANNSATNATFVLDEHNMRHTDSTGKGDQFVRIGDCGATFLGNFPGPILLAPDTRTGGSVSYSVKAVSAAATYVELQLLLSGTQLNCRLPLP